ncbi:MAG: DUF1592 domain-containing protein [Myxococcales bacterium]
MLSPLSAAAALLLSASCADSRLAPAGPISETDDRPWNEGEVEPGETPGDLQAHATALEFRCDADSPSANLPLRRLSRAEYVSSLHLALEGTSGGALADEVLAIPAVRSALGALPTDSVSKFAPFARMDQAMSDAHVQGYYNASLEIGAAVSADDARMDQLLGDCSDPHACIDRFIARFGRLVLRHPLGAEETAFFHEVYASPDVLDRDGLSDLIVVFLNSPQFLYEVQQVGPPAPAGTSVPLSRYELATRLSFQLWRSTPDEDLLLAAERGELDDETGFVATVDRMLGDPRAEQGLRSFAREWLNVDYLTPLDVLHDDPRYKAFAGTNLPSGTLREDMLAEVADSFAYHGLAASDTLEGWLLSPYSFARGAELASIYGVPTWNGLDEPPRFPDGQRAGLITRAALLSSASGNTRPIMKGVFLRERLLCDKLGTPDPNAALVAPEPTANGTTRQVVEALTQKPGTTCNGCHGTQLNALGFATENYDALGRLRSTQTVYAADGALLSQLTLDTASTPRVWADDTRSSKGATDLAHMLAESGKVGACFARQVVRFAGSRAEDESRDGCSLEAVRAQLAGGHSVRDALRSLALLPSFRSRSAEAE